MTVRGWKLRKNRYAEIKVRYSRHTTNSRHGQFANFCRPPELFKNFSLVDMFRGPRIGFHRLDQLALLSHPGRAWVRQGDLGCWGQVRPTNFQPKFLAIIVHRARHSGILFRLTLRTPPIVCEHTNPSVAPRTLLDRPQKTPKNGLAQLGQPNFVRLRYKLCFSSRVSVQSWV